jgi:putative NIF3 family GTP cyclohydrolase 1 type 2
MAITAQTVVDRIRRQCGVGWRDGDIDAFVAGKADTEVKGIAVSYAPSLEVLHKAVAAGRNMVISLESPFWARPASMASGGTSPTGLQEGPPGYRPPPAPGGAPPSDPPPPNLEGDSLFREKRDYIAANNLVIYRFNQNWNARQPNPQLGALVKALGWEKAYRPAQGVPWAARGAAFIDFPPVTLKAMAQDLKARLKMGSIRIIGEADTRVSRAAVKPGIALLVDLERYYAEPGVNLVIMGEPIWENEGMQYVTDIVAAGQKKGLILLGQEVSQEPGCGEMAAWLKTFVSEAPVQWIPAGDPSWNPLAANAAAGGRA